MSLFPLHALCSIARFHQISADPNTLAHQLAITDSVTTQDILLASKTINLKAKLIKTSINRIKKLSFPALVPLKNGSFIIAAQLLGEEILIQEEQEKPRKISLKEFGELWTGNVILFTSEASVLQALQKFDFTWFIPSIIKYRKILLEVFIISFALQIFSLITPLFFQVVMDKVLVNKSMNTLDVLVIGLIIITVFESVLSVLRSFIFSNTTSKIDVELGSRLFRHLLSLPIKYFQNSRVGDSVAKMREMENIRNFLTGNSLTLVIDIFFSFVFFAIMFYYSVTLTLVVLVSIPLYFCLSLFIIPILRNRLNTKFEKSAQNQAMLVESITGMQTIKASALEPSFSKKWDEQLASYVKASFRAQNTSTFANEAVNLISKLIAAVLLWYGARLVMMQELTLGQFIAFNMFAQRVSQPIIRLAQMWTEFQQIGISMSKLGDILNSKTEVVSQTSTQLSHIKGAVKLENITFSYKEQNNPVVKNLNLDVKPGETIGIVGRSGSGKSTLTKLIQKLYLPSSGKIFIDGVDINTIDPSNLRRQIGVVLQENILFNKSIKDNIAITDPGAPMEEVMQVAQLAGCHNFITELPEGYDTIVGEQGSGLSGGQRQRIAIARALFNNPKILIFDEATSALDYESEAIIQKNMKQISQSRTVFIIAHRLSAVKNANKIIVMDKGQIIEEGSHNELIQKDKGLYNYLWKMQEGHEYE